MLKWHNVPSSNLSEAADGLGRDESPCDPFDLNKLLHGQIRSGHHCSERRAVAAYVLEPCSGESVRIPGVVCEGALLRDRPSANKHDRYTSIGTSAFQIRES